jgi:hypothetical protein
VALLQSEIIVASTIGHGVIRIPKNKENKTETKNMYKKNLASKKPYEK